LFRQFPDFPDTLFPGAEGEGTNIMLEALFGRQKPLIGMVHLAALPGSPGYGGNFEKVLQLALEDAKHLAQGGMDGLLLENLGDTPYFPGRVEAISLATMTEAATHLRGFGLPFGINVLRNDARGALAVAEASGASFIRVNVHLGALATDQGILQGEAHETLRLRRAPVLVFADISVKHASPLVFTDPAQEAKNLLSQGLSDALIVSGRETGHPVDKNLLRAAKKAAGVAPLLIGSGVSAKNIAPLLEIADGAIVGTALKKTGDLQAPVDPKRVRALIQAALACHP
jgi:hypothetical protein